MTKNDEEKLNPDEPVELDEDVKPPQFELEAADSEPTRPEYVVEDVEPPDFDEVAKAEPEEEMEEDIEPPRFEETQP